jgi:phospholipid/cholesterol/gamma-HCH transport system ATP-binding protein
VTSGLDGVNLDVMVGESVVVVGGSGAGKTVLIKHMIGLMHPDSGQVVMDGVDLTTASPQAALEVRKRCGMSFQEGALFDSMTVFDNIAFPIRRHRRDVGPPAVAARVRECLGLVRLAGIEGKMPAERRAACGGGSGSARGDRASPGSCSSMSRRRGSTRSTPRPSPPSSIACVESFGSPW